MEPCRIKIGSALAWALPVTQELVVLTQPKRPEPVILFSGIVLLCSPRYMVQANCSWRRLFRQATWRALAWAFEREGRSSAARMAMTAMTTSNSIKVNARSRPAGDRFWIGLIECLPDNRHR